jgi:hypothetical protein
MIWIPLLLVMAVCVAAYTWLLFLDGGQRKTFQALVADGRARRVAKADPRLRLAEGRMPPKANR